MAAASASRARRGPDRRSSSRCRPPARRLRADPTPHAGALKGAAGGLLAVAFLVLSLAAFASPELLLSDDTGRIDRARVERAAAPLVGRGATVVVTIEARGDAGERFARDLATKGLLRGGEIVPPGIGLYVSYEPRFSELRVGARWSGAVPPRELEAIRQALNERLRGGQPTAALETALRAIEARIGDPWWTAIAPRSAAVAAAALAAVGAPLVVWLVVRRRRRRAWDRARYERQIGQLRDTLVGELQSLSGKAASAAARVGKEARRTALLGRLKTLRGELERLEGLAVTPESYQDFLRQTEDLTARYRDLLAELPAPRGERAASLASAGATGFGAGADSGATEAGSGSSGATECDGGAGSSESGGESRASGDW